MNAGLALGLAISMILLILAGIVLIPYYLGKIDIFWTLPHEGTAKAVMVGNAFHKFVMSYEGHRFNLPGKPDYNPNLPDWEVIEGDQHLIRMPFGLRWVGWYPFYTVYEYPFRWTEWIQPQTATRYEPVGRDEKTTFIFIKTFPYYAIVENAKTGGTDSNTAKGEELVPVDVEYILTLSCNNPRIALFDTEDWLAQVISITNAAVRNYIAQRTYANLISELQRVRAPGKSVTANDDDTLNAYLLPYNNQIPGREDRRGTKRLVGITICHAEMISVKLSGTAEKDLQATTTRLYVAQRNADAEAIEADGKGRAIKTLADARAYDIDKVADAMKRGGENAILAEHYSAIRDAGSKGNTIIVGAGSHEISKEALIHASFLKKALENKSGGVNT